MNKTKFVIRKTEFWINEIMRYVVTSIFFFHSCVPLDCTAVVPGGGAAGLRGVHSEGHRDRGAGDSQPADAVHDGVGV